MRLGRLMRMVGISIGILCLWAVPAHAVDSVYWIDYEEETINRAGIAGGGGVTIPISGAPVEGPYGLAIDSAAGKLYWTNWDANTIGVANLDGSGGTLLNTTGAEIEGPAGLAFDPAGGRIYWANEVENAEGEGNSISYANLDGSGGGNLNTKGATVNEPQGIVFDPASRRVFWANGANEISYAAADGSGGGDLDTTGAEVASPIGVAIDAATNRIFWGSAGSESIGFASLAGGSGGDIEVEGGYDVEGIALDLSASRVYFGSPEPDSLGYLGLSGGPVSLIDIAPLGAKYISFPILLKTPVNTGAPEIAKEPKAVVVPAKAKKGKARPPIVQTQNETFTCSRGSWAADMFEAFLSRAPQSFSYQWLRNDRPIAGATASSYAATEVGDYACRVTATNGAGATAKETQALNIQAKFALGKPTLNKKKGTAKLPVATSGSGVVALTGKTLKRKSLKSKGGSTKPLSGFIVVKAKGKALKKLKKKGKAKVKAKVAFTPTNGSALKASKSITLRLKR